MAKSKHQASKIAKSIDGLVRALNLEKPFSRKYAEANGYHSINEIAEKTGLSRRRCADIMRDAKDGGAAIRILVRDGKCKSWFYKMKGN